MTYECAADLCRQAADEYDEDLAFGAENPLEAASNGLHGPGSSCSSCWTLTKLVLLAGGKGDPIAKAGQQQDDGTGGRQFTSKRWTIYLEPLLQAASVTTAEQRRGWWLSDDGARARWNAHGGGLLCLIESMVVAENCACCESATKPTPPSKKVKAEGKGNLVMHVRPLVKVKVKAKARSETGVTWTFVAKYRALLCRRTLTEVAKLPVDLRRNIVQFAAPSLEAAITDLFNTNACNGTWDEKAFQEIEGDFD
jgi:hypothetical protein